MILISPPSIEEWWQNTAWLFIPLFSTNSHSCKTSLKWQLVQSDSERDGKWHRKNSINRNQNIRLYEKVFLQIIITAATSEAQDEREGFFSEKQSSQWWFCTDVKRWCWTGPCDRCLAGHGARGRWKVESLRGFRKCDQSNVVSISVHYWNGLCNCSIPPLYCNPDRPHVAQAHTLQSDRYFKMSLLFYISVTDSPEIKALLLSDTDVTMRYF